MPCTAVRNLIARYVEGKLDAEEERVVREHLAVCEGCRQDLADSEFFHALLVEGGLELPDPPKDFSEHVVDAVKKK